MNNARLVAFSSFVLALLAIGCAQAAEVPPTATLTVTGDGSVMRLPDRAVVSFQVSSNDPSSSKTTSQNAAISNALTARMQQLGIAAAAVATTSYNLSYSPRPSKPNPANDERFGFTVERTIAVTVDASDRTGAVIDAGVAAGATNVNGVSFMLRDPKAAQRAAQAVALDDAVAQARALASAAGVKLVRILRLTPNGSAPGPRPLPMMRATLSAQDAVPTTIDPTNLTVQANVTLEYEIAPARPI